jgi:hypothetical protein
MSEYMLDRFLKRGIQELRVNLISGFRRDVDENLWSSGLLHGVVW